MQNTRMKRIAVLVACIVACGSPPKPQKPPAPSPVVTPGDAAEPERQPEKQPELDLSCTDCDPKNPACRSDCRCGNCKCPSPPTLAVPACWAVMPCPDPPDLRVRACVRPN